MLEAVEMREVTSGLRFPEGPIAMKDGSVVAVSHQVSNLLSKYQPAAIEVLKAVSQEIPVVRNSRLDRAIAIKLPRTIP